MLNVSTTKQLAAQNLATLELALNQESPLNPKSYLRVIAGLEAFNFTQLYKFATERAKQNLALTATGNDLDLIGNNYDTPRKEAESAVLEIQLPGINGTIIPATNSFIGDSNGERYFPDNSETIIGGFATIDVTAENPGVSGNLNIGETLSIATQVPGAETTATVTDVINIGAERELDDPYRTRILDVIRAQTGGGNTADFRIWAQAVAGVKRAYPYSGRPVDDPADSFPPQRTVYIEADGTIDPDGIAPQPLLDEVRDNLNTDPDTGISRPGLGQTNETLFVESIKRTGFYAEVRGLQISVEQLADVQQQIENGLELYFRAIGPFIDGLDPVFTRNDLITDLTISEIIQDILKASGGSATGVGFGLTVGTFLLSYSLKPGETAKLEAVDFA